MSSSDPSLYFAVRSELVAAYGEAVREFSAQLAAAGDPRWTPEARLASQRQAMATNLTARTAYVTLLRHDADRALA